MNALNISINFSSLIKDSDKYKSIEEKFTGFKGHTMPMSFRKLIQSQLSANTIQENPGLGDGRSRHIKAFMAGTVGAAFTAVARIIRIAFFTAFLLPAVIVRFATANRYGFEGAVPELLKKYSEEWIDLGVTILSIPLGLCKTIDPTVFSGATDKITEYYLDRADRRVNFAQKENAARTNYEALLTAAAALRNPQPAESTQT
jgi:hypothetical protein